jgi:uncharacterized protein (TIGR03083 family)
MEISEHIEHLAAQGELLAQAAERTPLTAPVPSCPGWQLRDLLAHIGYVHRWATAYVADARPHRADRLGETELLQDAPPDDVLRGWFRDGHAALLATLRGADPAVRCWTFMDAPSPLAFWARRQTHETTIHRADAQLAAAPAQPPAAVPAGLAADGIDELVTGFGGRKPGKLADAPATLVIRAGDGPAAPAWTVVMGRPGARVCRGAEPAAAGDRYCEVSGPAPDLYLALWNRRPPGGLDVRGDSGVLASWLDRVQVRWA